MKYHHGIKELGNAQTLATIAEKLQIKELNINRSFCSSGRYENVTVDDRILIIVICGCNETVCHVTNIQLKGQNLTGNIPEEFGNLSYLQEIDLSRNYFSGSVPTSFSQLPLTTLSLLGNRINGSIPKEIGDIATLEHLVLEDNQLEGPLHQNLGNLSRLLRLLLSGNNFTGTIPDSFGNLKNLTDFRIDGSTLSGNTPALIGNWTKIDRLDMQGTSMDGPIPSTISQLKNITELRISDLNGTSMTFPDLQEMKQLEILILRNCLITGSIPDYIGEFTALKTLDLSFNMLTGQIPATFRSLKLNFMFLNNNSLSGAVPDWIINSNNDIDISYNDFIGSSTVGCQSSTVNLISSHSTAESNSVAWCLRKDLPCSKTPKHYSLFINCGGGKTTFEGNEYEEDLATEGPSYFYSSSEKWAYSSTGVFTGNGGASYKANNTFSLNVNGSEFYQTARLAPNSLKYYGLCLRKGSYKVRLHFAEIMYSDDQTFSSLGKRLFDVSIQGDKVLKDFNIMEKAEGTGKGTFVDFNDVRVNGSSLEIHLYWSGKGTTAIPSRGVYGPLISAISVTPNFDPHTGLSVGAIVGIVVASCAFLLLILVVLRMKGYLGGKDLEDKELRALELQTGYFSLRQIKAATGNFDPANKIGEGGFGPVYKGVLPEGVVIAVKQLSSKSKQGNREFVNEIGMISALQHPNLVRLFGCCIEGNQLLLIYEYMENNSLARALFGREDQRLKLDWPTRKKICLGIARGLAYLHEESRLKIVHRDIKATNVLLDKDLNAKISDFGLAKLDEEENTHISTRIAGTIGYMAPEYAMRGYLTDKADVYSFGIVALEIVSGKSNTNYRPKEEFVYLLDWAYVLQEQGSLLELVDPILGSHYPEEEVMRMLNIALLCTNPSPTLRPLMSSVVSMLEGKSPIQAPLIKRGLPNEDLRFKAFERISQDSHSHISTSAFSVDSQVQRSMSMDGPWIDSSVSITSKNEVRDRSSSSKLLPDLYDVNLEL
ncbi:probable LRR receptor-like serine/threonine-protein kinase At1g53430 isoform X2 [Rhododendron vialii]|uniref:probable LRR receptor-like serine/threonine-protein kinase At1g53430 isoform X2 n=1 Tax=Rhododendron vialii TaxID=182163 RepID=UPI00265D80EE|nr:probable LRR receptor-like serine/threonine-protein kinase At1g53430 isoform X2 [Rhododendron vialii]